jgi:hypothetical protein
MAAKNAKVGQPDHPHYEEIVRRLNEGESRKDIAASLGMNRAKLADIAGRIERPDREERYLFVSPDLYDSAQEVARLLGLRVTSGKTAGTGSVAQLIEEIGRDPRAFGRKLSKLETAAV